MKMTTARDPDYFKVLIDFEREEDPPRTSAPREKRLAVLDSLCRSNITYLSALTEALPTSTRYLTLLGAALDSRVPDCDLGRQVREIIEDHLDAVVLVREGAIRMIEG